MKSHFETSAKPPGSVGILPASCRFFNDSPELLVLNLLHDETIDEQEIGRLRGLIGKE